LIDVLSSTGVVYWYLLIILETGYDGTCIVYMWRRTVWYFNNTLLTIYIT